MAGYLASLIGPLQSAGNMAATGIEAYKAGMQNRLMQLQTAAEPERLRQEAVTNALRQKAAGVELKTAEQAQLDPARERALDLSKRAAKAAERMTDEQFAAYYPSLQNMWGQQEIALGTLTPEQVESMKVPLEQYGGRQGFIAHFSDEQKMQPTKISEARSILDEMLRSGQITPAKHQEELLKIATGDDGGDGAPTKYKTEVFEITDPATGEKRYEYGGINPTNPRDTIATGRAAPPPSVSLQEKKYAEQKAATREAEMEFAEANIRMADLQIAQIKKAEELIGPMTTGWGNKFLGDIPATDAKKLRSIISSISAKNAMGALSEMRSQSKDGSSGLGQITAREIDILISMISSLDQNLEDKDLIEAFIPVKEQYIRVKDKYTQWLADEKRIQEQQAQPAQQNAQQPQGVDDRIKELESKLKMGGAQ